MTKKLFTLLLAVAAGVGTMFAATTINGLNYNLDATNQTAEVTKGVNYYSGEIIIPSSVTYNSVTYSVTSIGNYAFSGCSGLTSVTIGNSVTSIGRYAFKGCSGLTSVIWNAKNCADFASSDTPFYDSRSQITSFTFGNEVEHIPAYLCYGMSNLTSIEIPNSVTSIGESAFHGCSIGTINFTGSIENWCNKEWSPASISNNLKYKLKINGVLQENVVIPNSVTSIGKYAFYGCSSLTSVTIPNSVTSIGYGAFDKCTGLTSVTIPNSVTEIDWYAFYDCSGLTSVTIPNSVTSIGDQAFAGCSSLTSIEIPNSVTNIGERAFAGCSSFPVIDNIRYADTYLIEAVDKTLSTYTIKDGTKWIGNYAFYECRSLTSVTIPNSVTSIGGDAFRGCTGLTSVTIPNSVTEIDWYAFYGCTGLTSVTIPNSVTSIGWRAFSGCSSLTSPVYNAHVFAFMPTSYSGAYTIPDGIESIAGGAFEGCSGLTSVTIEAETPPTLGSDVFYNTNNCPIYVPCGTLDAYKTAWSAYASRIKYRPLEYQITGNVNIEGAGSVQLPQNKCEDVISATPNYGYHFVRWRDGNTDNPRTFILTQDTTLTAEFAPDRVGTCGKDLALVWSYDPTNKVLTIGNAGSFTENMQFGLEAPNEMEELVIGNSVTAIGANAFAGIETLKKIIIGESVKTIGEQAFYNCVNLETIFNYRPTPTNTYSNAFDGVDKFECTLYVLPSSIDMYKAAAVWRDFYYTYAIGAEEATVTTNDVTVEPQDNAATVTWPTNDNAATYTIQITKDGEVFCTLIFNANGQLTGIAFAPSRDGQKHAPQAIMTANGMQFTVTGLDSGTHYALTLQAKDSQETVLASYSSEFTTTGQNAPQGLDEISSSLQGGDRGRLIYHDGQIFILRGEKIYTLTGQEIIVP